MPIWHRPLIELYKVAVRGDVEKFSSSKDREVREVALRPFGSFSTAS
jgi:hypothetical protein